MQVRDTRQLCLLPVVREANQGERTRAHRTPERILDRDKIDHAAGLRIHGLVLRVLPADPSLLHTVISPLSGLRSFDCRRRLDASR